jgi:hypothetical protein
MFLPLKESSQVALRYQILPGKETKYSAFVAWIIDSRHRQCPLSLHYLFRDIL